MTPARRRRHLRRRVLRRLVVGFIVLSSYNAVVALRQRIDKAWSNIDVVLKQRHDQLPNLVAAVRGPDGLRAGRPDARDRGARRLRPDRARSPTRRRRPRRRRAAVRSLFAVVERYPDIKSAANVRTSRTRSSASRG